jgi:hypothetical protein
MDNLQEILAKADQLSDTDLRKAALQMLKLTGYPYPDFLPSMDTSREGLLDLIAGISAIADAKVIEVEAKKSGKGKGKGFG